MGHKVNLGGKSEDSNQSRLTVPPITTLLLTFKVQGINYTYYQILAFTPHSAVFLITIKVN